ncbi:SMC-Scp complex subunit ScpB [Actinomyces gaoshouyii]|uniref:SMC-Scp complex subunit ScpB n=1 Tax=Actinomyces gaoshouyii TaxID=1960083 RepID=UPI0009C0569A|nr:SMC-Scp complex subunit ScpB [Actinomyces gaoshouyii]ARD41721.1 SMC-Scp complex subunit ScpB [Actinomyces gaoshouyii]
MSGDGAAAQVAPGADGQEAPAVGAVSDELLAAAEAVLVVSDEPVTPAALGAALGLGSEAAEALLQALAAEYRGESADGAAARRRGFILRRVAGGWRLASAPEHAGIVESFVVGGASARLSQAALETLAVVAYRQPVTRGRIAAIRGVNVDGVVRTLHARGLIEEAGNETSGAILYRTTNEFLEYLGIDGLDELPPLAPHLPDASQLEDIEHETETR